MSRLKPAFGAIAPQAAVNQAASRQQRAWEEDTGLVPDVAHLVPRECVDASLQGGDLASGVVVAWHPKYPILAVATSVAVVEYDALSGCRRNFVESAGAPVKLRYTPDGEHLILLTKERNVTSWSTSSWRRRQLLVAEARYADRPLVSGLLAVSAGPAPIVYYSPVGKHTLRTVHMAAGEPAKGARPEKELAPGFKLRTDNKKPIVALAAHPSDPATLFLLLVDGSLLVCGAAGGALSLLCGLSVKFDASKERVQLVAVPHPQQPGAALLLVEAERSGLTVLAVPSRNEVRVLAELELGAGAVLAGSGLLHRPGVVVAAVRHAGGNVGVRCWRLRGDARAVGAFPMATSPPTVWDALQSASSAGDAAALADVAGEAVLAGMAPHGPSGLLAFWTARQDDAGAAHLRLPLLAVADGEDPAEGAGAAAALALHTAPGFWTAHAGHDGVVSKLHFPRYAHVLSPGRVASYDLTHGLLADCLAPPPVGGGGQGRALARAVRSAKQGLWLPFMRALTPGGGQPGQGVPPGALEWTAVPEAEAAVAGGAFWLPGRDAAFVGSRDELLAVLSNSGALVAVFDSKKLVAPPQGAQQGGAGGGAPRALYVAELKECTASRVFPGPPAHIPAPPEPRPDLGAADGSGDGPDGDGEETDEEAEAALQEWEEKEARRLETPRRLLLLTTDGRLALCDVAQGGGGGYGGAAGRAFAPRHALKLRPSEAVVQVTWQSLMDPAGGFHAGCEGAGAAAPAAAAVLTSQRALVLDDRLRVMAAAEFAGDVGSPTSALWVGPALLVTTAANQIFHLRWDGGADHLASLLSGPPATLVAALADRVVLAARGQGPGLAAGRAEVAPRGFAVLPPMLVGWAGAAARGVLPGGAPRARQAMRTLLASYDASQLPVAVLEALVGAGFADVAAAAAAASELPGVTPARRAALAAAAGDWSAVVALIAAELEASEWAPAPPPKGSALHEKVVALARACEAHGRFVQARELFEAAGAWGELLALCVFQGDLAAVGAYGRAAGRDVAGLADQLLAVNENTFMRLSAASAFGGRPNVEDWTVVAGPGDAAALKAFAGGEEMEVDLEVAPAGRLPLMEASLRVSTAAAASGVLPPEPAGGEEEEGSSIARLDLTTLEAYLGVAGAALAKDATATPRAAAAAAAAAAALPAGLLERTETGASADLGMATAAAVLAAATPRGADSASAADSEADAAAAAAAAAGRGETLAQSAARAAFAREQEEDDDDFFSSDEDSAADGRSAAASSRFLINIRAAEETPRGAADGATLRAAAAALKLGGSAGPSAAATPRSSAPGRSSMDDDRSSVSSMETFGAFPKLHTIPTPPPAAPLLAAPPPDPFAAFADLGGPATAAPAQPAQEGAEEAGAGAAPIVSMDPFAELPGLPPTLAQAQAHKPAPPGVAPEGHMRIGASAPLAEAAFSEEGVGAPMRPQAPPPVAQSDLLSGWDEFEALFTGAAPAAAVPAPAAVAPVALAAEAAAPPRVPSARSLSGAGAAPVPPPSSVKKAYNAGLAAFKKGQWGPAAEQLAKALGGASGHKDAATAAAFRRQCAHLYAAASLVARSAAAPPAAASRLSRFAAALPLGEEQRAVAAAFAVEANMAAGNYGWAGDQLAWLVVAAAEGGTSGPGLDAATLADRLAACDRAGARDSALPADEDVESFAEILGSCEGRGEVDDVVRALLEE